MPERVWFFFLLNSIAIIGFQTVYMLYYLWYILPSIGVCYIITCMLAVLGCGVGWLTASVVWYYALRNLTNNEASNWYRYPLMRTATGKFRNPYSEGPLKNLLYYFHLKSPPSYQLVPGRTASATSIV